MSSRSLRFTWFAWTAVLLAAGVSVGLVQIMGYSSWPVASQNGLVFAEALISVAALPFFIVARHHFSANFRRLYVMLGVGIGLYGLAQLQIPLLLAFPDATFWINSGLVSIPFLVSTVLIYLSVRQFTKVLGVSSRMALPWVAVVAPLVGAVLAACSPLIVPGSVLDSAAPNLGFAAWSGLLALLSAGLVSRAAWRVTSIYSVPLGRLNTALSVWAFSAFHYVAVSLFLPADSAYVLSGMLSAPSVAAALLFVWAGVAFNLIGEIEPIAHGSKRPTSLNIITYTASLAADPDAIDTILDGARGVSALLEPGASLTPEMQRQLADVYLQLEEHLTTKEELQAYTQDKLRQQVSKALHLDKYGAETFWPLIRQTDEATPLVQMPAKTA